MGLIAVTVLFTAPVIVILMVMLLAVSSLVV